MSRQRSTNSVVFRRILIYVALGQFQQDLRVQSKVISSIHAQIEHSTPWEGVQLATDPRIQVVMFSLNSFYANAFVDFLDSPNAASIKQVMGKQIYLNGSLVQPVQSVMYRSALP